MKTTTLTTLLRAALAASLTLAFAALARAADAPDNWKAKCAMCHAADGSGNTAIGKKNKLQDYTSAEVQTKLTNEEITKTITDGKKPMPSYKDKLTPDEIKALAAYIRTLKK